MENSDVDRSTAPELSCYIYPVDEAVPGNAEIFYREWIKKHAGKIPIIRSSDRDFICDLFLCDVNIREKLKKFIAETPVKEKLSNIFF